MIMENNPLNPETEKDPAERRKECLEYMADLQKYTAEKCGMSETTIEDLDTSIRGYRVLKLAGVKKVSDIPAADFSGVADLMSLRLIDEIRHGVFEVYLERVRQESAEKWKIMENQAMKEGEEK